MSRFAACWKDEALKACFTSDPNAVQAARDIGAPDGLDVRGVENSDRMTHLTIPMSPELDKSRRSDEELAQAAAGVTVYVGRMQAGLCHNHGAHGVRFLGLQLPDELQGGTGCRDA